jgi:hypothetical protein
MSPVKLVAHGLAGCRLAAGTASYTLADGSLINLFAIPVSLQLAEPCLRHRCIGDLISMEQVNARGLRIIRGYDDAVVAGLA